MRTLSITILLLIALGLGGGLAAWAQEGGGDAAGTLTVEGDAAPAEASSGGGGFLTVVTSSGWIGIILWLSMFAGSMAGVWLTIDSFVKIQEKKIFPETLVSKVREAMEQGDVMKALNHCKEEPGPLANILSAGFSNVEEGFETVQEAIGVAADLESEKLMQRVNYLNVVGNIEPMLGLLGTVQGMIFAFATLATGAGAAKQAALAMNISQALYTTAAGLCVAIPAVAFFFYFRNRVTNILLSMEMMTMDLVKGLRNVEVVEG
jgi:biopolymer transport protein ExbB